MQGMAFGHPPFRFFTAAKRVSMADVHGVGKQ